MSAILFLLDEQRKEKHGREKRPRGYETVSRRLYADDEPTTTGVCTLLQLARRVGQENMPPVAHHTTTTSPDTQ